MLGQQLPRTALCSSGPCPHQAFQGPRHSSVRRKRCPTSTAHATGASSDGLSGEPSTSGRRDEIDARLAEARKDLQNQWAQLRAGTLSSTGPGRPDGGSSLPERLLQLVTGRTLVPGQAAGTAGQPLQHKRQRQEERQRQQQEGAAATSAVTQSLTAHTADVQQQPQQGQQQEGRQGEEQLLEEEEEGEVEEQEDGEQGVWLTTTNMLVVATWLAFLAQWWTLLPDLAAAVLGGKAVLVVPQFMTMYPDTPVTHMLQLDILALLHGHGFGKLLSCSLLHSGFAAVLMCTDGLNNVGSWLEPRMGSLQLLATFLAASFGSCAGQLLCGHAPVGISGSGACVGMYAAWCVVALTRFRGTIPISSDRGLLWCVLNCLLALYQPAIGLPSVIGGAVGGAIGALCAAELAQGLGLALALPVMAAIVAAKVALEAVRLLITVVLTFVVATWRAGEEALKAVRNL